MSEMVTHLQVFVHMIIIYMEWDEHNFTTQMCVSEKRTPLVAPVRRLQMICVRFKYMDWS